MKKIIFSFIVFLFCNQVFATDSILRTTNPLPAETSIGSRDGTILTVNNGDLGNADTSYSYFNLLNDGYNAFVLRFIPASTTLTIEGTIDPESTTDANSNWVDLTYMLTSDLYASFTKSGSISVVSPLSWNRLRIKRVTTNAANSLTLRLTRSKI